MAEMFLMLAVSCMILLCLPLLASRGLLPLLIGLLAIAGLIILLYLNGKELALSLGQLEPSRL